MFRGPLNRDNSGNYVGHRLGSSGINEDTLMLSRKKRTLSQDIGRFYDRCVQLILHPQKTIREHREFVKMARKEKELDREVLNKRLSDRSVTFQVEPEDWTYGLNRVNQEARAAQAMSTGEKEMEEELERTRDVHLFRTGVDIDAPLVLGEEGEKEITGIRQRVGDEIQGRKEFHGKLRGEYAGQHGELDGEIERLKAEVAGLRKEEQLWEARLDALRWYQRSEKHVPRDFRGREGDDSKKMTRAAIYGKYSAAFEAHHQLRKQLANKVEKVGKLHDQERYPKAQMDVVNQKLQEFNAGVQEQFAKDFDGLSSAAKQLLRRADSDAEGFIYRDIVAGRIEALRDEIEILETSLHQHHRGEFKTKSEEEQQKMHTDLAALRIMYGALYRMRMMSEGRGDFEERIKGYLEGKPDPEEVRVVKEAERKRREREAILRARTERPFVWNIFSSDDAEAVPKPKVSRSRKVKARRDPEPQHKVSQSSGTAVEELFSFGETTDASTTAPLISTEPVDSAFNSKSSSMESLLDLPIGAPLTSSSPMSDLAEIDFSTPSKPVVSDSLQSQEGGTKGNNEQDGTKT